MTAGLSCLVVLYVVVGCVAAIVADAAADIAGVSARAYVRVPLAIGVVLAWLPMLVILAVVLTLGFVVMGIRR